MTEIWSATRSLKFSSEQNLILIVYENDIQTPYKTLVIIRKIWNLLKIILECGGGIDNFLFDDASVVLLVCLSVCN